MKVVLRSVLREALKPLVGVALLGGMMTGCGDESDPEAVSVKELKYPGGLVLADLGGGSVKLTWSGSNNESDFDGYNVYGMADADGNRVAKQGTSLQLLNDEGEPVQEARDYLALYNYDPTKRLAEPGAQVDESGEAKFSALPIHSLDGETRLLPTCKPNATTGACDATTAATAGQRAALNGSTSYTVERLTIGTRYCFLVLSSMKGGKEVSQTSSNIACITPKYEASIDIKIPPKGQSAKNLVFDLRAYLKACDTAGSCSAPSPDVLKTDGVTHDDTNSPLPLYIEQGPAFVSGKNAAVAFVGIHAAGFASKDLPAAAPELTIDTNKNYNGGGYAVSGQSVPIQKNGVYVVAVSNSADDTNPTRFRYHWIWVNGDPGTGGPTVEMKFRLSKNLDDR